MKGLAGQAGLEPATFGFGDRRSTNWSYWPVQATSKCYILAGFLVQGVMTTPAAVLLELDALRIVLLILLSRIVTTLALGASKGNQSTHVFLLLAHTSPTAFAVGL